MGFSCSGFLNRLLRTADFSSVISGRTLSHVASLIAYTFKQTVDFSRLPLFPKLFTMRDEACGLKLLESGIDAAMLGSPKMLTEVGQP